jgi:DNA-binding transcriptional ArsR family regulator
MRAKREYRDRAEVEVAVLDALVDRAEDGMTVFELRAAVDADIDRLEEALSDLKGDGLIDVERDDERTMITPDDRVVPDPGEVPEDEESLIDEVRDKLGF